MQRCSQCILQPQPKGFLQIILNQYLIHCQDKKVLIDSFQEINENSSYKRINNSSSQGINDNCCNKY